MAILIKDGNNSNVNIHTIDDGTGVHFNQSIPTDVSGHTAAVVSGAGQAAQSGMGGLVVALHPSSPLPAGTNLIGKVSIQGAFDVSVGSVVIADNAPVSVRGGRVSIADSTIAVTKSGSWAVSVADSSLAVTQAGVWAVNAALTSTNNNVALTSVGTSPVAVGTGAAATALRVAVAPNTDKTVIGAVSLADGSITVGTHAVTQSGTWNVNAALTSTNNSIAITSVGTAPVAVGTGAAATAIRVAFSPNTDKTLLGMVSIGDSNVPVTQSGTWNVNAALTSTNNNVAITSIGTAPIPVGTGAAATAMRIALSPNADKTLVGLVSLGDGILANSGGTLAAQNLLIAGEVSTAVPVFAAKVQAPLQLDTSGQLRISKVPANTDKVVIGAVSLADGSITVGTHAVTQSGTWNVNAALTSTNNNVALTSVGTAPVAVGTGAAATAIRVAFSPNVDKTLVGMVSIGDSNVPVTQSGTWNVNAALTSTNNNIAITSIGTAPIPVGTGAAATAMRIALSPNADKTLVGMVSLGDGILALPNGTLAVNSVLIGAEVSTASQTYTASKQGNLQMDTSGRLKTWPLPSNADKTVIGAVSLAGISPVSIAGVVTVGSFTNVSATAPTGAFFMAGVDPSGDLIGLKVDSTGAQRISGFMSTPLFVLTRPNNTTAYTANDGVSDNVTSGSNKALSWPASRFNAGTSQNLSIRRARIRTNKTTNHRGQNFRLHLWNKGGVAGVSCTGDNLAFSAGQSTYYVGAIDVSCDYLFTDGAAGIGSANKGTDINIVTSTATQTSISGWLEILTSLSPIANMTFSVYLEIFQD